MKIEVGKDTPGENKSAQKKPYHSPKLSSFGTVTQLTQTNTIHMKADGGPNMGGMSMRS